MKKLGVNFRNTFLKKLILHCQQLFVLSLIGFLVWTIYNSCLINYNLAVELVDQHVIKIMTEIDQNLLKAADPKLLKYNVGKVSFIPDVNLVPESVRISFESRYSIPGSLMECYDHLKNRYYIKILGSEVTYWDILEERQDVEMHSVFKLFLYRECWQPRYFEVSTLFIAYINYIKPPF